MKKSLAILLSLALVICMIPATASVAFAGETKTSISPAMITLEPTELTYDGEEHSLPTVKVNVENAVETTDYTVEYYKVSGNSDVIIDKSTKIKDAGDYKVKVSAVGSSSILTGDPVSIPFKVKPLSLSTVTLVHDFVESDIIDKGAEATPRYVFNAGVEDQIGVKVGEVNVKNEVKLTIVSKTSTTVTIKVEPFDVDEDGTINVTDSRTYSAPIKKSVAGATITLASGVKSSYEYTGEEIKPTITVKKGGVALKPNTDYTVSYSNNINAGSTTKVTITGAGDYISSDYEDGLFTITAKPINKCKITAADVAKGADPQITVKDGDKLLVENTNYTVSGFNNNQTAGTTVTATITGTDGNYTGTATVSYKIVDANNTLTDSNTVVYVGGTTTYSTYYDGYAQTPKVDVYFNSSLLSSSYYTVAYADNTNPGTATITITGKYPYTGTITKTFTISSATIKYATISGVSSTYTYTGLPITPSVSVYLNGKLVPSKDYKVTYSNNTNVSTAYSKGTLTITPNVGSGYTDSCSTAFTILPRNMSDCTIAFAGGRNEVQYSGYAVTPEVTVKYGYSLPLTKNVDYTLSFKDENDKAVSTIKDAGTYKVIVTGKGNYTGTKETTFKVTGTNIQNYTVTLKEASVQADGYSKTPVITSVQYGTTSKLTSSDYTVSYQDSTGKTVTSMSAPGTYKVVVTGKNGYLGSTYATFKIVGLPQTVTVDQDSYKKYPTSDAFKITAKASGDATGFNYTSSNPAVASVSSTGVVTMHKIGKAVITVTTTGNKKYETATKDVVVKVYPKKTAQAKKPWTDGKKAQLKVRWNYQDGATKYQIRYSRDKNFKAGTYLTKTVNAHGKDYTTQSTTLTKLKRGYTYYVKVRAVYTDPVTGDNYYGSWSGWRSAKTI